MDITQSNDIIASSIGVIYEQDRPSLLSMLNSAGYDVNENSSESDVYSAAFLAIKDSSRFRKDLQQYIVSARQAAVADEQNLEQTGLTSLGQNVGRVAQGAQQQSTKKSGKTAVGSFLSNLSSTLFTKENLNTAVQTGINIFSTKLQQQASRQGEERAIQFEIAKAQAAAEESKAAFLKGGSKNKWIAPVAIIGGLAIVGVIIYFVVKKKK
jgi:hypothetical protein